MLVYSTSKGHEVVTFQNIKKMQLEEAKMQTIYEKNYNAHVSIVYL
jgi:hypothetical protein